MKTVAVAVVAVVSLVGTSVIADEPSKFTPVPITLNARPCVEGWQEWQGIADIEGFVAGRERITSLSPGTSGDVWVGTSHGRLLSMANEKWNLVGHLKGIQITGIAFEGPDKVWLSTSDGIRRLEREKEAWKLKEYRTYYEGHPSFVSGGYIPGEDAVRLWGYVDDIYIPPKNSAYSPFAISTEHGLFCWASGHGVWHHFMPHYWGANSSWLDTRELVPHRRPTCIVEDAEANLWIGTEWDGIVRLNARGRDYHNRSPEKNKKDGIEFTLIGPKELGFEFDKVLDLTAGLERGVWAVLGLKDNEWALARFDRNSWTTMTVRGKLGPTCVAEVRPGVIFVGHSYQGHAMVGVEWSSRQMKSVPGPKHNIFKILRLPDCRIFTASWFGLYEKAPAK
jgi:hypothetical protein